MQLPIQTSSTVSHTRDNIIPCVCTCVRSGFLPIRFVSSWFKMDYGIKNFMRDICED
jgi:hypothetical protein